eukprot:jgi/Botrbrau1/4964/Bobra.0122s0039.1
MKALVEKWQVSALTRRGSSSQSDPPTVPRAPNLGVRYKLNCTPRLNLEVAEAAPHCLSRRGALATLGFVALQSQGALGSLPAQAKEEVSDFQEVGAAASGQDAAALRHSTEAVRLVHGRPAHQTPVIEGLAAGRGGGNGLLLLAAAAAPAYLGFKVFAGKASNRPKPPGRDNQKRDAERGPPPIHSATVVRSNEASTSDSSASTALARLGAMKEQERLPAPAVVPMPALDPDQALQQAMYTVEAIKQEMARNDALMEELKSHFRENGEQVRLLTGRIDWQQKSLQGSVEPASPDPLDSTGQAMSQILQDGTPEQLQKFLEEDQKRLRLSGGSAPKGGPKMLPPSEGRPSFRGRSPPPPPPRRRS